MANIEKIAEELSSLTVMEAADLSKMLEEKWGVSAVQQVAVAPVADTATATVEQTEFNVTLKETGGKKIEVIKVVRAITGLGLKEAKALVDGVPSPIKSGVSKSDAEDIRSKLEAAGASVEVK